MPLDTRPVVTSLSVPASLDMMLTTPKLEVRQSPLATPLVAFPSAPASLDVMLAMLKFEARTHQNGEELDVQSMLLPSQHTDL